MGQRLLVSWRCLARVVSVVHTIICIPNLIAPWAGVKEVRASSWFENMVIYLAIVNLVGIVGPIEYFVFILAVVTTNICLFLAGDPDRIMQNRQGCYLTVIMWLVFASLFLLGAVIHSLHAADKVPSSEWEIYKPITQISMILLVIPFAWELSQPLGERSQPQAHSELQLKVVIPVRRKLSMSMDSNDNESVGSECEVDMNSGECSLERPLSQ